MGADVHPPLTDEELSQVGGEADEARLQELVPDFQGLRESLVESAQPSGR